MRLVMLLAALFMPICAAQSQHVDWSQWNYFVGDWIGEGTGAPGQGNGGFSFAFDLQGAILVRKNYSEFPATEKSPAYRHDDLMVMYPDGGSWSAEYYDNEGHVIHYAITFNQDSTKVIFTSKYQKNTPSFRLTYTKQDQNHVNILFEFAAPSEELQFKPYIEAVAVRKVKD